MGSVPRCRPAVSVSAPDANTSGRAIFPADLTEPTTDSRFPVHWSREWIHLPRKDEDV
jgi:hypothetical protein